MSPLTSDSQRPRDAIHLQELKKYFPFVSASYFRQDGYFYPLHVAAEMGHKALIILLVQVSSIPHLTTSTHPSMIQVGWSRSDSRRL
jgi:hypothetical protein